MTKMDNPFHAYVEDLFANLGRIRIRKMFGGAGVYSGEDMFALINEDRVYVKSDDSLKADLESEGGESFEWTNPNTGKTIKMSYVSLPVDALRLRFNIVRPVDPRRPELTRNPSETAQAKRQVT